MKPEQINFDSLPESALVPVGIFPLIAGISVSTAWRRSSKDPTFPKPVKLGSCTRWRVSDIRRFLRGEVA